MSRHSGRAGWSALACRDKRVSPYRRHGERKARVCPVPSSWPGASLACERRALRPSSSPPARSPELFLLDSRSRSTEHCGLEPGHSTWASNFSVPGMQTESDSTRRASPLECGPAQKAVSVIKLDYILLQLPLNYWHKSASDSMIPANIDQQCRETV